MLGMKLPTATVAYIRYYRRATESVRQFIALLSVYKRGGQGVFAINDGEKGNLVAAAVGPRHGMIMSEEAL